MLQKLPVGIQSFSDLRSNNYIYIDKTEAIYRLVSEGKPYFLSRPRRFGKSLLISTLDCLFSGKKELFKGLYIYDKWDWTQTNPVIRFDFGKQNYQNPEKLEQNLIDRVDMYAEQYGIELKYTWSARFAELIEKIHEKTGRTVVVLVDEYDKAIIDNLKDVELADKIRVALHNFYQILKATDDHLRFVFLTGVSKFTKVSIFSGLNNLNDITIAPQYATICGITQTELETCFAPYIDEIAKAENSTSEEILERIKYWYNGFSWDGKNFVYNPFSTLQLFSKKQFVDYWFASGSPTFLIDILKKRNDIEIVTEPFTIPAGALDAFDIDKISTKVLLFQTGYLTVKAAKRSMFSESINFVLDIPNEEVKQGLMTHLVSAYSASDVSDVAFSKEKMMEQLFEGDASAFELSLQKLFAHIPHQLHIPQEAYCHSLFLLWFNLLGFKVDAEVSTDKGRIDAVWTWQERIVIAEIKYARQGRTEPLLEKALSQLHERRYVERYQGENKRIALLAIAFAGKNIASRIVEI